MTATVEPPAQQAEAPVRPALRRADGLELLGEVHGSGYKDGASLVRRADGQMVQLGPLMYSFLECVDGRRRTPELAAAMCERLGRNVEEDHVIRIAEKLADQGLLAGTEENAPARSNPLLALRWKYLITNSATTRRVTQPFTNLFRPWLIAPVLVAFLGVVWFVLVHKGVASATAEAFKSPELLLLVFALAVGSAGFHELGHAAACRYGGATPGGMGVGIYLVWPAFYTDVTDSYRLPRRDRLRTDLGGLYFNTIVAVCTLAVWAAVHVDALLLLVALQLVLMVKQLSPMIRADGYHILSDLTGVPDLYAHIIPTLKRLIPGRQRDEQSALTGRARALVTAWVLLVVPLLFALSLSAVLLFPKIVATAWASGSQIAGEIPHQLEHAQVLNLLASGLRLFALVLPVFGVALMSQKILRGLIGKARSWSAGRPPRHAALGIATAVAAAALLWAWWPSGQYQPVHSYDNGTLVGLGKLVSSPQSAARPAPQPVPVQHLKPGKHLAVAMIPQGGATKEHPAFVVLKGDKGQKSVVLVTDQMPAAPASGSSTSTASDPGSAAPDQRSSAVDPNTASDPGASGSTSTPTPVPATALPFDLPSKPGPHGTQALAVNTKDGAIKYDIAYTLVTVKDGAAVDETNEAYALASCNACNTFAVSFQVVLVIGQSDLIAPINIAGALNKNCPSCITAAIATQIVVTLKAAPSPELLKDLGDELEQLDALTALGATGTPEEIARRVDEIQGEIQADLVSSGLMTNPPKPAATSTGTTTTPTGTTTTPTSTTTTPTGTDTGTETTPSQGAGETTTPTETTTTPTTTDTSTQEAPSSTTTDTTTTPSDTGTTSTTGTSTAPSSSDSGTTTP